MNISKIFEMLIDNAIMIRDEQLIYLPVKVNGLILMEGNRRKSQNQKRTKYLVNIIKTGESVLDLGCNTGYNILEIKRGGAGKCLGIDAKKFLCDLADEIVLHEGLTNIGFLNRDIDEYIRMCIRNKYTFDNILLMATGTATINAERVKILSTFCKKIFIEQTNHQNRTKEELFETFQTALVPLYKSYDNVKNVKFIMHTDYQDRLFYEVECK